MAAKYSILARVNADGSGFMRTMNAMEVRAGRFANTLKSSIGNRLAGIFSVGAIGAFASRTIQYGSQLADMAARTGDTVENLQRLNKTLEDSGSNLQELESFWSAVDRARMRALRDPGGKDAAGFERFGIGAADLSSMGKSQLTAQIAAKFQSAGDNWQPLVSSLAGMRLEVGNLVEAFRLGLYTMNMDMKVLTTEQAIALDDLSDRWVAFSKFMMVEFAPVIIWVMRLIRTGMAYLKFAGNDVVSTIQLMWSSFRGMNQQDLNDLAKLQNAERNELWSEVLKAWKDEKPPKEHRKERPVFDVEALDPRTTAKRSGISPLSDSLLAVGNFLGSGRVGLETLATRQVQLLGDIARNTQRTVEKLGEDGFPVAD